MRRDFDLLRLLLLHIEGESHVDLASYSDEQVKYHQAHIIEADFAEGVVHYSSAKISDVPALVLIKRLTWEGREFLDKARN